MYQFVCYIVAGNDSTKFVSTLEDEFSIRNTFTCYVEEIVKSAEKKMRDLNSHWLHHVNGD